MTSSVVPLASDTEIQIKKNYRPIRGNETGALTETAIFKARPKLNSHHHLMTVPSTEVTSDVPKFMVIFITNLWSEGLITMVLHLGVPKFYLAFKNTTEPTYSLPNPSKVSPT